MTSFTTRLDESPRGQIVKLLQQHGPLGVMAFRREMNLSDTAVRQQIKGLLAEGYLHPITSRRTGVGRPEQLYELTDKARDLFACYCEDLALNLYEELLADQGEETMRRLLTRVGARLAENYSQQIRGAVLQERVSALSRALDHRGILSSVTQDADVITLYEYNCPYHELAAHHRQICDMEKDMMSQVLTADVELTSCMMDGHNGCAFTVRQYSPS